MKVYIRGWWEFKFFTGGVKCEVMRNGELGICYEYFEAYSL